MSKWTILKIRELFQMPFFELVTKAHNIHEDASETDIEKSTLLNIKTGACPENCSYCPQSGHYKTGVTKEKLLDKALIVAAATAAKEKGAKRFCMGAAWRSLPKKEEANIQEIISAVKALNMETCITLGMLDQRQANLLKEAGLDYYNHNLDCSEEYYPNIVSTRTYQDRLDTLSHVANAELNICCGGILGLGESLDDRISLLHTLSKLKQAPKSIPINRLIAIKGTPLENNKDIDDFAFIKMIAVTRIMFPKSRVRLSAGRESMSETLQAWCFYAGANSIFYGEKLLMTKNNDSNNDDILLKKLDLV